MNPIENIRRPVAADFSMFEQRFAQTLQSHVSTLNDIFTHLKNHRGKHIRPILTLLSAKLCGNINEKTIDTSIVLELLHTASLLHDDVIDNADTRHSQPSVNKKWSNKLAILSGDYLLATAMSCLTQMRNTRIQQLICDLSHTLSEGEVLEINYGSDIWITEQQYFEIIKKKTASLFATCTEAGAISVGATAYQANNLHAFGDELGTCFQLQDDIFDYSENEQLGKPTMNDIRDKKVTLPLLVALQRAPQQESEQLKQRIENDVFDWELENDIKSFVMRYDGIRYTRKKIEEHKRQARLALTVFHPVTPAYEALLQLLDFTTQRTF